VKPATVTNSMLRASKASRDTRLVPRNEHPAPYPADDEQRDEHDERDLQHDDT